VSAVADGKMGRRLQYEIVLEQRRVAKQMLDGKKVRQNKEILVEKRLVRMQGKGGQVQTGLHLSEVFQEVSVCVEPGQGGLSDDGEKDG
jgi:hypothetical protein